MYKSQSDKLRVNVCVLVSTRYLHYNQYITPLFRKILRKDDICEEVTPHAFQANYFKYCFPHQLEIKINTYIEDHNCNNFFLAFLYDFSREVNVFVHIKCVHYFALGRRS